MTTALVAMTTAIGMGAAPVAVSASSSPSAVRGFSNNSTSELGKIEFQKSSRLLNISQTMVDPHISQNRVSKKW